MADVLLRGGWQLENDCAQGGLYFLSLQRTVSTGIHRGWGFFSWTSTLIYMAEQYLPVVCGTIIQMRAIMLSDSQGPT